jgi:hypothetical protein
LAKRPINIDLIRDPPFETSDLRKNLKSYLDMPFPDPVAGGERSVGNFRWGVYAFFDYDGEPIYVGQTNEMLRTRIRRHLTNQRTDAVAMSVLDPFEVYAITVWPLPQFQDVTKNGAKKAQFGAAKAHLNALERAVYDDAIENSEFKAILNEKDPPAAEVIIALPSSCKGIIVSESVHKIRSHPDFRIARRALMALERTGWSSLIIWECELADLLVVRDKLVAFLQERGHCFS